MYHNKDALILILGGIAEFLFLLYILDRFYKRNMKRVIDEIHRNYERALRKVKEDMK